MSEIFFRTRRFVTNWKTFSPTEALCEKFTQVTINVRELDPVCAGLNIVTKSVDHAPQTVMTNSSAFGGSNVSLILRAL